MHLSSKTSSCKQDSLLLITFLVFLEDDAIAVACCPDADADVAGDFDLFFADFDVDFDDFFGADFITCTRTDFLLI